MTVKWYRFLIYTVFFFSGLAGLIYQVVWARTLALTFGISTHSVVAVTSAFMAGLALGAYLSGKLASKQNNILRFYAVLEIGIGLAAILLPVIFHIITPFYRSIYQLTDSSQILWIVKFLITFVVILIPTTAMGATLPSFIEFSQRYRKSRLAFETANLYGVNTLGAFAGVLLSGFILIEILGLLHTMWLAVAINLVLGITMWQISRRKIFSHFPDSLARMKPVSSGLTPGLSAKLVMMIFGLSGLISMAYEVIWIRLLIPTTGTFVYAFSFILALILLGIAVGSFISKLFVYRLNSPYLLFGILEFIIGGGAVFSILATTDLFNFPTLITELLVILPATIAMGMTFPLIMRFLPKDTHGSAFVGTSYMFNTVGSMLGPIIGSFILLPVLGATKTVILLSCLNFALAGFLASLDLSVRLVVRISSLLICVCVILILSIISITESDIFKEKTRKALETLVKREGFAYRYLEDESASVMAFKSKSGDNGLLVDGVGMTGLGDETKLMAHLPILLHPNPKDMLIIGFGMGTTYRSALTYGINVDGVELIPSVVKMFPIFFEDAEEILNNRKGKIIISDGRNYVRLTSKKYDLIQVDPPPPVNAAGTTVLYSQEFYEESKRILTDHGIFVQWIFLKSKGKGSSDDIKMLIRSFVNAFPHVLTFRSPRGTGMYLVGSLKPVKINLALARQRLADNPKAFNDLTEWSPWNADRIMKLYSSDQSFLKTLTADSPPVTDMFPRTEYFLLRHALNGKE